MLIGNFLYLSESLIRRWYLLYYEVRVIMVISLLWKCIYTHLSKQIPGLVIFSHIYFYSSEKFKGRILSLIRHLESAKILKLMYVCNAIA